LGTAPRSRALERAAGELRDELRRRDVETYDVEHSRICWISDREVVRDHADDDEPRVDAGRPSVVAESLYRVDVTRPRLGVGVDHERVDLSLERLRVEHRQRAVGAAERQIGHRLDDIVETLPRGERQRRQTIRVTGVHLTAALLEAALAGEEADDLVVG